MILFKLSLKNIISRKSSFVIVAFIQTAIMLLFITNTIFDRTDNGIKENYIKSLTGDVVIRPVNEPALSLFGDESPFTGSLSTIPFLEQSDDLKGVLSSNEAIKQFQLQYTVQAVSDLRTGRFPVTIFGVEPQDYFNMFKSLTVTQGSVPAKGEKGALVNTFFAEKYGVKLGDVIQVIIAKGINSKIRKLPVKAIYSYPSKSLAYESLLLCDIDTAQDLCDAQVVTQEQEISKEQQALLDDFDMDSFFEEADAGDSGLFEAFDSTEAYEEAAANEGNFAVCMLQENQKPSKTIKALNKVFKKNGWKIEAVNWRSGAGNTTLYISVLRIILNIGILVILFTGFIIVNNTLIINVLDRFKEIGTMRAIGAKRRFISLQFMTENMLLAVFSGVMGIILGIVFSKIINNAAIPLTNSFIRQLLGSSTLITKITLKNIIYSLSVSFLIGAVSWIYPVITALNINPVEAMRE